VSNAALAATLRAILRALPDDDLIQLFRVLVAAEHATRPAPAVVAPVAPKPAPLVHRDVKPAKAKTKTPSGSSVERLYAVLKASPGPLPPRELRATAGLSASAARAAFVALRGQGKAEGRGARADVRWGLAGAFE